jgi:hypothetical protein
MRRLARGRVLAALGLLIALTLVFVARGRAEADAKE